MRTETESAFGKVITEPIDGPSGTGFRCFVEGAPEDGITRLREGTITTKSATRTPPTDGTQFVWKHVREVSAALDPVNETPGWMVMREPETTAKAGRVLSDANLKLVMAAMDALRELIASTGDLSPLGKAHLVDAYGRVVQDAGLPLVKLARAGDLLAGTYLRAALADSGAFVKSIRDARLPLAHLDDAHLDDDAAFVKVLKFRHPRTPGGGGTAGRIHPAVAARQVCGALFRT